MFFKWLKELEKDKDRQTLAKDFFHNLQICMNETYLAKNIRKKSPFCEG